MDLWHQSAKRFSAFLHPECQAWRCTSIGFAHTHARGHTHSLPPSLWNGVLQSVVARRLQTHTILVHSHTIGARVCANVCSLCPRSAAGAQRRGMEKRRLQSFLGRASDLCPQPSLLPPTTMLSPDPHSCVTCGTTGLAGAKIGVRPWCGSWQTQRSSFNSRRRHTPSSCPPASRSFWMRVLNQRTTTPSSSLTRT